MENKKSLYRIYRPKTLDEIAGHDNLKNILTSQLINDTFPNAIMLCGQKGTGKTSTAKIFAKIVNCKNRTEATACDGCESCKLFNQNNHPDIFEIDAASNNGVDEIRNLKSNLTSLPMVSQYKVYIIDEVHMLTIQAFNALLKMLEEPPKHVIFILATTEMQKIPETVLSRCQIHNFKKIDKDSLVRRLKFVSEKENINIEEDAINEIFYFSEGSLRDALNYLELSSVMFDGEITLEKIKNNFNMPTKCDKLNIIFDSLSGNYDSLIKYFEEADDKGFNFETINLNLINILKEVIEFRLTNNDDFLKSILPEEISLFDKYDCDSLFDLAFKLSESYSKTSGTNVSFQYLLLSLIKDKKTKNTISVSDDLTKISNNNFIDENKSYKVVENIAKPIIKEIKNESTKVIDIAPEDNIFVDASLVKNNINNLRVSALKQVHELNNGNFKQVVFNEGLIITTLKNSKKDLREIFVKRLNNVFKTDNNGELINPELANQLAVFFDNKINAVSDNCVIITVDSKAEARAINNMMKEFKFRDKLFRVLDKEMAVCVLDKNTFKKIGEQYKFNISNNIKFEDVKIDLINFYDKQDEEKISSQDLDDEVNMAKEFFGNSNIKVID